MSSTAYAQDDVLIQLADIAQKVGDRSIRLLGGFVLALFFRFVLAVALGETRESVARPEGWRPKPGLDWPEEAKAQLVELDRFVQADVNMKRSYLELMSHLRSTFPSFGFFSWVFGLPGALDRWFDVRMDGLLVLIAVRRASTSVNASGLSPDELQRRIG